MRSRPDFYWFLVHIGTAFWKFLIYLGPPHVYVVMLVSRFLFEWLLGLESGCPGSENSTFCNRSLAKVDFRRSWHSHDSRVHFFHDFDSFGPVFMTFVVLETGSKFDDFSKSPWIHPDPATILVEGNALVFGPRF